MNLQQQQQQSLNFSFHVTLHRQMYNFLFNFYFHCVLHSKGQGADKLADKKSSSSKTKAKEKTKNHKCKKTRTRNINEPLIYNTQIEQLNERNYGCGTESSVPAHIELNGANRSSLRWQAKDRLIKLGSHFLHFHKSQPHTQAE